MAEPTALALLSQWTGRDYAVRLTPEDAERAARHRTRKPDGTFLGYEEHASYALAIELPYCGRCGRVAARCPCHWRHTLPVGVPVDARALAGAYGLGACGVALGGGTALARAVGAVALARAAGL